MLGDKEEKVTEYAWITSFEDHERKCEERSCVLEGTVGKLKTRDLTVRSTGRET